MKINIFGGEEEPAWDTAWILHLNSYPSFMAKIQIPKVSKHIIRYDLLAGKTFMAMGGKYSFGLCTIVVLKIKNNYMEIVILKVKHHNKIT